jgi:hypothetical protein
MSDGSVRIDIISRADPSGFSRAGAEARKLNDELSRTPGALRRTEEASNKAAKGGANFGQAMLQSSRGIQDFSAAGLNGIINNLEGIAAAAGLGAGAAGGVTLLAVAFDFALKNWNKFSAATKDAPSLGQLTPEDEEVKRMDAFAAALERQATGYKRLADEAERAGAAIQKQMQWQTEMEALISKRQSDEEKGPNLDAATAYDQRAAARVAGLSGVEGAQAAKEAELLAVNDQFKAQQKRVSDIAQRDELQKQLKTLAESQKADAAKLGATTGTDFFSDFLGGGKMPTLANVDSFMRDMLPSLTGGSTDQDTANTAKRYREQAAKMAEIQKRIGGMPGLNLPGGLTGDAVKDRETMQAAMMQEQAKLQTLKNARDQKAQEVAAGQGTVAAARGQLRNDQLTDLETYSQQVDKETGSAGLPAIDPAMLNADAAQAAQQGAQIAETLRTVAGSRVQALTELAGGVSQWAASASAELSSVRALVNQLQQQVGNLRQTPP